ncbi:MAG TPA: FxLYD domain-containing protein [Candidatus Limnocylindrales bacterium]|nr:FxLYD domain-containing protein [Candidatus Limnocylindrales bacterium]
MFRNPYDFPVQVTSSGARLVDGADETIKTGSLYFLDGISGGSGYLLPAETIGANVCFTCERALLTEDWAAVEFSAYIKDATDDLAYSTEVAATGVEVEFDGDSPIFWITGNAENTSASTLDRISVRVIVFDKDGSLIGAAESSGWDVPAGDSVELTGGYGLGENPNGPFDIEVTALGVDYSN